METLQTNKIGITDVDEDLSADEEQSTSADYHSVSDNNNFHNDAEDTEEELTNATDYDTLSDAYRDGQHTSMSDYRTLSPDSESLLSNSTAPKNTDYQCKICIRRFSTLQECLRHELLDHGNGRKSPQRALRLTLKTMLPVLDEGAQADRPRIHKILQNSQRGTELNALFSIYCISDEKIEQLTRMVTQSLFKDLWHLHNISIYAFGSILNGLMTWDSDVDIYITAGFHGVPNNRGYMNKERVLYNRINSLLRRGREFEEIVTIRRARVPIIKCRHIASNMKVDINCSCPNSVVNSRFLEKLLLFDVRLRSLMRFLKIWAKQMKLIGRGNMTSYCLTTLILFYLQQPSSLSSNDNDKSSSIVPSIVQLQTNVRPNYVQGINYAYDIYHHMRPIPNNVTTSSLIRGFFKFYHNFDFSKDMIAPYLGTTISLTDFKNGKFQYIDYERQLESMKNYATDINEIEDLCIEHCCMIVQDPFQLNHNIARGVSGPHMEYFLKCLEYAYHICQNFEITNDAELYERLLFDVINEIETDARALRESAGRRLHLESPNELLFSFTPSRVELRALTHYQLNLTTDANFQNPNANIYHEWIHHYVEAIYAILAFIFRMNVELVEENTSTTSTEIIGDGNNDIVGNNNETEKHTKLIEKFWKHLQENGELIWHIKCSIDLWSGRMYNRQNANSFMEYQIAQTEQLLIGRKNMKAYAVDINGFLKIKPEDEYKSLAIIVTHDNKMSRSCLTKKDPLRRFFTSFKNSMQNFNLKEKLQAESGRKQMPQTQDLKIWKKRTAAPEFSSEIEAKSTKILN